MKRYLFLILVLLSTVTAFSQTTKGFRGMFNVGYTVGNSITEVYSSSYGNQYYDDSTNRITFKLIGGYQLSPAFFVGAGVGMNYCTYAEEFAIPIFADVRYDLRTRSRFSFFANVQIGYSVNYIEGFNMQPSVGVRYALNDRLGLSLGIGYEIQSFDMGGESMSSYNYKEGNANGFAVQLGFEF